MPQGEKEKHESYGMLQISRTQRGGYTNLFGSSIKHSSTIRLSIHRGTKERGLNTDWYYADVSPIVEIEMSPTQFAEAITSLNMGSGVPATIRRIHGKMVENCPEENKRQLFEKEFDEKMKGLKNKISKLTTDAKQILTEKKTLNKSDRETILNQIAMLEQEIGSNAPFVLEMFNEQMDKTVTEAKGEVEAFVQNKITSLGIEGLKAETLMLQESKKTE